MSIPKINATVRLVDEQGRATPELVRWMNAVTNQLNALGTISTLNRGGNFSGLLTGRTAVITNGVVVSVT